MKLLVCLCSSLMLCISTLSLSQGKRSNWLLCYDKIAPNARIKFSALTDSLFVEHRKITMRETQANISRENGTLIISSNGTWIANATGDTMKNGAGLSPGLFTSQNPNGLPLTYGNVLFEKPGDSSSYVLVHQTGGDSFSALESSELYYSEIDISADGGLGEVVFKNQIFALGNFGWGIGACKHANGRDWWIFAFSSDADSVFKYLLTPQGIALAGVQDLAVRSFPGWAGQPIFSFDGTKFAYIHFNSGSNSVQEVRLFSFDRCSGAFINKQVFILPDSIGGFGVSFSPNSRYLYASSFQILYQFDTYSSNVAASRTIVAINDTFPSPVHPFYTSFWTHYFAPNGKIYLTSGSSVVDLHYINYPDSSGLSSDVYLHDYNIPCFNFRSIPNHPNYYLGPVTGSACDSLSIGIDELEHNFNISIFPNPTSGEFNILYLLPQNKPGLLELYDMKGNLMFSQVLPHWSTTQSISVAQLSAGVYHCVISSNEYRANKKVVIMR